MTDITKTPPPWVEYPGYGPGDGFWRQTGEAWMANLWQPFWASLTPEEQAAYHAHWHTPQDWLDFHFPDSAFQQWLDTVDDEDDAPTG